MVSSNERTYDDLCLSATVDDNSKVWLVDSGASIHCPPHRDCFSNYVHGDYGHVTVGNGYRCSIVGKGKVEIKLSNGGTLVLKDVRHIPELQKNLISVSGLDREGYFVAFGEKQWKVTKGSMVVARGERVGTLYTLSGTYNHSISLAFIENQRTTLWHHRLGHLSESGMKILHSKNALLGMKNIQLDFCEGCVYGKQKRVSFQRDGKEKKIKRLELVHTDVCGPTTVKSLGGNKVKCLKSDNGSEYRDEGFQEYCSNNGIRLIRTVKRTPQENGLAERMNRTIMERARCMRIHADLPLQFWAAAVDTAVYLTEVQQVLSMVVFLKKNGQKCVFIGYGGDEYGYRLWDYKHNKIIRSRDVIFDESRLYKHRLQEHGIGKDNTEYMELDEPKDGQVPRKENPEVLNETTDTEIGAGDQQQVPETLNLKRSSREEYIEKVLRRFNLHASKPVTTPLAAHFKLSKELSPKNREDEEYMAQVPYTSAVGSLMYAMIHDKPKKGILASSEVDSQMQTTAVKETTGEAPRDIGGTAVSWISKLQKIVALSTTEAEYVAMTEASKEIIWLQRLLTELGYRQVDCKLWTDSQSAIHLAKNSAFHSRTKHIHLRYHFIRSLLEGGQLNLEKIEGNKNPADMLTKDLLGFKNSKSQDPILEEEIAAPS
ncbi:hypothetical protein RJ639_030268 [Escallonia herrerae]|uniref:Integrase catalytic domain-containing protein n=1 Tax=Escallonia herrerae TaxID=1293975 RepID=A0AA89BEP8_9ASTE|nr:hypothetical protein RJ639_030268 [Escallonia herrerae]